MKKIIRHTETLIYYDEPELFLASDQVGTEYICLMVTREAEFARYLCVPISKKRLSDFYLGEIDLRTIYADPETDEFYYANIHEKMERDIPLFEISKENIQDSWLPEPGFKWEPDAIPDEPIVHEARHMGKAIIYLVLNPPESRGESKIYALNLSEAIRIYQGLVKYAFKKAITPMPTELRQRLDLAENYKMQVTGFSPGSFTVHMQSESTADALGYVEIAKALRRIDEFFGAPADQEKIIEVLKQNKGHLVNIYRNLLNLIIEQNSPISYKWAMPELEKPIYRTITKESALSIYQILTEKLELSIEEKKLVGRVIKADVRAGSWTLISEEDNKEYRGKSDPQEISLGGIILETALYKFVCEEHLEEEGVTGREKTTLILKSFVPMPQSG